MSLRDFLYNAAHDSACGVAALEVRMQKAPRTLQNALNPNMAATHRLSEPDVERLLDFIPEGNLQAARYFADKTNALVIRLPDVADTSDMALLDEFLNLLKEIGQFSAEFQKDYEDGRIDARELRRLNKDSVEIHLRMVSLMHRIEEIADLHDPRLQVVK